MGLVSVTLLGGFSASVDRAPVPTGAWRLKKARELVKLLALAPGHRMHREQAIDVLWRDRAPGAAANNLNQAVHAARRALDAEAIGVHDGMLELSADVDVDRLADAAQAARRLGTPTAYRNALSLYGGDLLPENRYDDWASERRDELAGLASELKEELHALGPAGTADRLPPLPADPGSFVGRRRELAELAALLRGTRMLTLAGAGGVGKTRLALELARAVERSRRDGAALVELASVGDARRVPAAFAAALDVRAQSDMTPADAVAEFLAPRSLLLVVDNCEHLLSATAGLAGALLRRAPGLTILATSREPLRVPGEVVFRVPSLDIPDPEGDPDPAELARYEAVQLFVERATAAAPGFVLDERNAADVARICFRLDGLPLALELAAGRMGALGPAAIAERLGDRFRVLRTASRTSPTRQQTLTATLEWSHDLLEADERTLLRRLAAFSDGFELDAVERVCTGGDLDTAGIADVLARLVEKSLVAVDERPSADRRYRLLETVRLYARDRLDEAGEASAVAVRHARWALATAEAAAGSPRLDRDASNLRLALGTLLDLAPAEALRLCVALLPFWMRRIDLHEARERFDDALAAAPERTIARAPALLAAAAIDYRSGVLSRGVERAEESRALASELGDTHAEWRALQFLGESWVAMDATSSAVPWLERALELARREGYAAEEALGVYSLGVARWLLGDPAGAEEHMARSSDLFAPLAGSPGSVRSPLNIAEVRTSQSGGRRGLRVVFEDTLQPFAEISFDTALSYVLANRAGIARVRGDSARARTLLDESAARFAAACDEAGQAAVLVRRAYLELADGAPPVARAALEEALAIRRRHGDRRGSGLALAGLGLIDTAAGEGARAERRLTEALAIFRRAGDRWGLASTLWRTADLALSRDDLDGADAALQEARVVLAATRRERWIASTLSGLAEVAALRGDTEGAAALLADARGRYALRDDALGVADVDERLGELAKHPLSPRKEGRVTTAPVPTTKG